MSDKKDKTREHILQVSYPLFAEKGFKQITMKDICQISGMSRGGLYSHFSSTAQIFEAILKQITSSTTLDFQSQIANGVSATDILKKAFKQLEKEMLSPSDSLSLAIFEYSQTVNSALIQKINKEAEEKWSSLFKYGIKKGEFLAEADIQALVNTLLYVYQGIRLWQSITPLKSKTVKSILRNIEKQLTGDKND